MLDSARFKTSSPEESDDFTYSHHQSHDFSFEEDRPVSVPKRSLSNSILQTIEKILIEAQTMSEELSNPIQLLKQAKSSFLRLAERESEREIQQKRFEIERVQENLSYLISELINHKKTLTNSSNQESFKEQFLYYIKEKVMKTASLIEDEKNKCLNLNIDLEIVSKEDLKETKDRIKSLSAELDKLKLQNIELTPDTARLNHKFSDSEQIEEIDDLICQRIRDLHNLIQTFATSRPESLSLVSKSPDFDPNFPLRCFDGFRLLESKILSFLRTYSSSTPASTNSGDSIELKNLVQTLSQENLALKQKLASFKAQENELSLLMRNKELSFEEKISDIKEQTQVEMMKMQEALSQMYQDGNFQSKISLLENELKEAQDSARRYGNFDRELENVRKIYTDKYDELFRITSAQISELELKVKENSFSRQSLTDEVKNAVRREENKIREIEIARINQIHTREVRILQSEFEDFLAKSRVEIIKLGKLVEKAISNSDYKLLNSIQQDINSFHRRVESQATRVKDESFSILYDDDKSCRRCGLNDSKSRYCQFHPYLIGSDAQDFLYSKDWHRCREEQHKSGSEGCVRLSRHLFSNEIQAKGLDRSNKEVISLGQSRVNDHVDTPSRTLHEALFSTDKKIGQEVSASDLLDSYIAKYAN